MSLWDLIVGKETVDEEVRRLIVEYPSGNQYSVLTNKENANEEYASDEYDVVSDEPYTYKEPGFFGWLFGGR